MIKSFQKTLLCSLMILCVSTSLAHATTDQPATEKIDPTGYWLTQNERAVIKIDHCGTNLCGKIHWIIKDGMTHDTKNHDAAKRSTPLCGLQILNDFTQNSENEKLWDNGTIYKADEGETYHATINVIDEKTLNLRGYIGIPLIGKTQTWTRVDKKSYPKCTMPSPNAQ